jgi:putative tryptophan/tyrosine transport system substrate-binding protein
MSRHRPFIGMFMNLAEDDREISARREAFLQGVGAIPGLTVATCFGAGDFANYDKKAQALHDLVVDGAGPDLYFTSCWPSLRALMGVAGDRPIVFAGLSDLSADPAWNKAYGSNVYGFLSYGKNLCGEWPRLLRAVAPAVARAAVLYDMSSARPLAQLVYDEIALQAGKLIPALDVTRGIDCASTTLDADLAEFMNEAGTPAGLIVAVSVLTAIKRQTIINLTDTFKLPVVYPNRLYTFNEGTISHGGLVSRGTYIQGLYRSAGVYAQKLIKGQQPSPQIDITQTGLDPDTEAVFETVVNVKAAAAIDLTVDPAVLMNADLVID